MVKPRSKKAVVTALVVALSAALVLGACKSQQAVSINPSGATVKVDPAMTSTQTQCPTPTSCWEVGNVATISGIRPGLFKGAMVGVDAYLSYVNSQGGVDGRKFKLLSEDDAFSCSQNKQETLSLVQNPQVISLVGNFSLEDGCGGQVLAFNPGIADVSNVLDPPTSNLPNVFSEQPIQPGSALGGIDWFRKKFPSVTKVGTLVGDVAPSPQQWAGQKAALEYDGYSIAYERYYNPLETDFTQDVLAMEHAGVQMVYLLDADPSSAAHFESDAATQGFHPQVTVIGASIYSGSYISQAGGPSVVDGEYVLLNQALFLGGDESTVPEVGTFLSWVNGLYPGFTPDLFTFYGWTNAELFVDALRKAGPDPTRASLLSALSKITSFNADGLVAPSNPAKKIPPTCYLIAQINNGQYVRTPDMPKSGFVCGRGYYYLNSPPPGASSSG